MLLRLFERKTGRGAATSLKRLALVTKTVTKTVTETVTETVTDPPLQVVITNQAWSFFAAVQSSRCRRQLTAQEGPHLREDLERREGFHRLPFPLP
jgi:hypothetical protein